MTQVDFNEILRKLNAKKEEDIKNEVIEEKKKEEAIKQKENAKDEYDIAIENTFKTTESYENTFGYFNNDNIAELYNYETIKEPKPFNLKDELLSFVDSKTSGLRFSGRTIFNDKDEPEQVDDEDNKKPEKTTWIEDLIYGFFNVVFDAIKFIIGEIIDIIKFIVYVIFNNVFKGVGSALKFGLQHMVLAIVLFFSMMCVYRILHFSKKNFKIF